MEKFQEQVLQRLSRIESALEILVSRISNLEQQTHSTTGELWEALRTTAKEISENCDLKRKVIQDLVQGQTDRLELRFKAEIQDLEKEVNDFEKKVFDVEKGVSAGETTTRDVLSLQERLNNLISCVTQNKIAINTLNINFETVHSRLKMFEKRFEDRGKNWPTLIISLVALLSSIIMVIITFVKSTSV